MTTIFYCYIFIFHIYFLIICTACRAQTKTATLLELMQVTQYKTAAAATKKRQTLGTKQRGYKARHFVPLLAIFGLALCL